MHLFLTDRLSCPRCGPEFGLILLAREMRERRIIEGELGCSNCREQYPVEGGFGDLRMPPRSPLLGPAPPTSSAEIDPRGTFRMAALLGVTEGPGTLLLQGPAAVQAGPIADLLSQVEVVGVDPSLRGMEERDGVSRMVSGPPIPFFTDSLRAVLFSGDLDSRLLQEGVRVVAPLGRLVVLEAEDWVRGHLEGAGLTVLLEDEGVVVAIKEGGRTLPLTPLRVP